MNKVIRVNFKQVYDLVFRARNSKLNSVAYVLDFCDWIKAGVAFNTRGYELSSRKISYFAKLYDIIQSAHENGYEMLLLDKHLLEEALVFYYEDIYEIYQDHLKAKHSEARQKQSKSAPDFGELLVLPCFDSVPEMREVFTTETFPWDGYECVMLDAFKRDANSVYLDENTALFKCMSMMYDYGRGAIKRGVLLEVKLWDSN